MLSEEKEVLGYIKEAFELRSQELYKPAIEMLYKALSMDNDNVEVLFQLGELYSLMHNHNRALGYLEQVLLQDSNHLETLKLMQKIYHKENKFEDSLAFAKNVFELERSSDNLLELVKLSGKLNLLKDFETYKQLDICSFEVIYEMAKALHSNKKNSEAKDLLEQYKNEDAAQLLLGKIYFEENDLEKAREVFSNIPKTTENPEILNYQGLFALEDMNFIEAIKYFSKATSLNKNNSIYFYNLGNAYFFNGWMEEAQKAYSKAIYLTPNNMDYRYALAYLYFEIKSYDKCKKEIDAILTENNTHYQARVIRALLLNNENEFMQAKAILEENVENGCDDDFTLTSLGKTYNLLDMFEKAEKVLSQVLEKNPQNLNCISDLADVYIKEKEFEKALELAQKTIELNSNYIYGYILGAKIAYLKGDWDKTKEFAQEALALDMNCSEGYYYLALVRFNEEDFEEAIECMKRAITYDASNPLYYAEMSKIYKAKDDIKTALEYISEAESIDNSTEYKLLYKELAALNRKQ